MLFARFSLLGKSYAYMFAHMPNGWLRNAEFVGVAFFYTWFSAVLYHIQSTSPLKSWALRAGFVGIALAATSPIHVQVSRKPRFQAKLNNSFCRLSSRIAHRAQKNLDHTNLSPLVNCAQQWM